MEVPMSESHRQEGQPKPEQDLEKLYELRLRFAAQVYEGVQPYPEETYEEFVTWWAQLPAELRAQAEKDYRKGYEQVVKEGSDELRARSSAGTG